MLPTANRLNANELRLLMRQRRQQLGLSTQIQAARHLQLQLIHLREYQESRNIAFYWAVNGELSCQLAIKHALKAGKHCYLPVITPDSQTAKLQFARYLPGSRMACNQYGIPEPMTPRVEANELELVLTPFVAIDRRNNRLGMGGGYYDRTFDRRLKDRPTLLGVGFDTQLVRHIQSKPWDVAMDKVILVPTC